MRPNIADVCIHMVKRKAWTSSLVVLHDQLVDSAVMCLLVTADAECDGRSALISGWMTILNEILMGPMEPRLLENKKTSAHLLVNLSPVLKVS